MSGVRFPTFWRPANVFIYSDIFSPYWLDEVEELKKLSELDEEDKEDELDEQEEQSGLKWTFITFIYNYAVHISVHCWSTDKRIKHWSEPNKSNKAWSWGLA